MLLEWLRRQLANSRKDSMSDREAEAGWIAAMLLKKAAPPGPGGTHLVVGEVGPAVLQEREPPLRAGLAAAARRAAQHPKQHLSPAKPSQSIAFYCWLRKA